MPPSSRLALRREGEDEPVREEKRLGGLRFRAVCASCCFRMYWPRRVASHRIALHYSLVVEASLN